MNQNLTQYKEEVKAMIDRCTEIKVISLIYALLSKRNRH